MKGIILCGGKGTRLAPLTNIYNKHLVAVYDKPMIDYSLGTLQKAGITDILVVSGREHAGQFVEYLGSGSDRGLNITYRVQEGAGGIGEALALGKDFIGEDGQFAVILGDNIFENIPDLEIERGKCAKVFLKVIASGAGRFGVAKIDLHGDIESIVEKPKDIDSGYVVTGFYIYPHNVFNIIENMKPSARGELEITNVNQHYIETKQMDYQVLTGFWSDAGTPESLAVASQWAIEQKR